MRSRGCIGIFRTWISIYGEYVQTILRNIREFYRVLVKSYRGLGAHLRYVFFGGEGVLESVAFHLGVPVPSLAGSSRQPPSGAI